MIFIFLDDPDAGVNLIIVFKRRIMSAILTIYVPTFLILCIVYATNFFKEFFFEAIVTVNLTALLVLTTLFISVSGSLPATAYVKMVDIWLIFGQLVPWMEVRLLFNLITYFQMSRFYYTRGWTVPGQKEREQSIIMEDQEKLGETRMM